MDKLIKALEIFKKYLPKDSYEYEYPTHCEHDVLIIGCDPDKITDLDDIAELEKAGFIRTDKDNEEYEGRWISFHFGSA